MRLTRPPRNANPFLPVDEVDRRAKMFLDDVFFDGEDRIPLGEDGWSQTLQVGGAKVELTISVQSMDEEDLGAEIEWLRATPPGTGVGAKVLRKIIEAADRNGFWLSLVANTQFGKVSGGVRDAENLAAQKRLLDFYRSFGFEMDLENGESLEREMGVPGERFPRSRNPTRTQAEAFIHELYDVVESIRVNEVTGGLSVRGRVGGRGPLNSAFMHIITRGNGERGDIYADVELVTLEAGRRRGTGLTAMRRFVRALDRHGLSAQLVAQPLDFSEHTKEFEERLLRLEDFYRSFGFEFDERVSFEMMFREPR